MSSIPIVDPGAHPALVRLSYLVLISLASCAKADPPETFIADPSMQNDFIQGLPDSGSSRGFTYAIIQGLAVLEGDIILGHVDQNGDLAERLRGRGVGKSDAFNRWPDGIVVYERPVNNSEIQQQTVEKAIAHWTEHTTLSFVERTAQNADQYPHYIQFQDTQSCASHVGMIGGPQPIYISDACSEGSIIHEIGHAIGLFHEHTRPDRDNFVQIDWDEIVSGKEINFDLQNANIENYSAYDYGSIMHYGEHFFSQSGAPTIIVADGIEIGQREALSPLDIESANNMYETDLALGSPSLSSTASGLEIDITIYNQGELGAQQLQLVMRTQNDANWKGVSRDSGWDCLTFGPELKCTRATLREQTESRFSVLSEAGNATIDDLSIRLVSRTQDADFGNNVLNDDGIEWQTLDVDLTSSAEDQGSGPSGAQIEETEESTNAPDVLAASVDSRSATAPKETATAAAGRLDLMALIMLFATLAVRRVTVSLVPRRMR